MVCISEPGNFPFFLTYKDYYEMLEKNEAKDKSIILNNPTSISFKKGDLVYIKYTEKVLMRKLSYDIKNIPQISLITNFYFDYEIYHDVIDVSWRFLGRIPRKIIEENRIKDGDYEYDINNNVISYLSLYNDDFIVVDNITRRYEKKCWLRERIIRKWVLSRIEAYYAPGGKFAPVKFSKNY